MGNEPSCGLRRKQKWQGTFSGHELKTQSLTLWHPALSAVTVAMVPRAVLKSDVWPARSHSLGGFTQQRPGVRTRSRLGTVVRAVITAHWEAEAGGWQLQSRPGEARKRGGRGQGGKGKGGGGGQLSPELIQPSPGAPKGLSPRGDTFPIHSVVPRNLEPEILQLGFFSPPPFFLFFLPFFSQ